MRPKSAFAFLIVLAFASIGSVAPTLAQENSTQEAKQKAGSESNSEAVATSAFESELLTCTLADGETTTGKLYLPNEKEVKYLVMFIHGTGPGTYLNRRKAGRSIFNFFDMIGEKFNEQGVAFFSYNKRGCEMSEIPPMYDKVDREKFRKVVPSVEVQDIATIMAFLRQHERLSETRIILYGASEGTVIASAVAENKDTDVAALFLAGYAHENMWDIIKWQYSGHSSMLALNPVFDTDKDGAISQEEYEFDGKQQETYRKRVMGGVIFSFLDANKNGSLNADDFGQRAALGYKTLMSKIEARDDDWIWKNYFRISTDWLYEHYALEANKTRLLRLNLPIYVFHGTDDPNVDVQGVYDLDRRFVVSGKKNLQTFVFEGHEHSLNFIDWVKKEEVPEGMQKIFDVAGEINRGDE